MLALLQQGTTHGIRVEGDSAGGTKVDRVVARRDDPSIRCRGVWCRVRNNAERSRDATRRSLMLAPKAPTRRYHGRGRSNHFVLTEPRDGRRRGHGGSTFKPADARPACLGSVTGQHLPDDGVV